MAIRSISRLQHRRGLKSDLPPKLNEGEIGWCLDTRELFIGNSDAYGGNSQVLTQWTPNDRLIQHAYQGSTGLASNAISRPIGSKLDDFANVRDWGAVGNGIVDDHAAIQKAIMDCYSRDPANDRSPLSGFVTIWFPAGTYRITSSILLYPNVRLRGEGMGRTKIILDPNLAQSVMQTADGDGNTEGNIGADGAILPADIDILDMWLETPSDIGDVIRLQRAHNVTLEGVRITGPRQNLSNVEIATAGIRIESLGSVPESLPRNIVIKDCDIAGVGHAIYSDDPITDLRMDLSLVHDCWHGVTLGYDAILGGPSRTRITNTSFVEIESWGIGCFGSNLGVISMANSFDMVGDYYGQSAIVFGAASNGCASIGDQFTAGVLPGVQNLNPTRNVVLGPQNVGFTNQTPVQVGPITLEDAHPVAVQYTTIEFDPAEFNNIRIEYTLNRNTNKRMGRLTLLTDGTQATLQDEFTTLGADLGVTFGYDFDGDGMLILTYNTTITGFDATMTWTETKWHA